MNDGHKICLASGVRSCFASADDVDMFCERVCVDACVCVANSRRHRLAKTHNTSSRSLHFAHTKAISNEAAADRCGAVESPSVVY